MLAIRDNATDYFVLKDHLGSTRVAFNGSTGAVVAWFDYSPYGKVARSFETSTMIRYTYTGQERDSETGLMNYKARMYDPAIGRFYAMDPMGQTPSFYNYCGNNPVSFTDPDGEWFWMAVAIAYGAFQGHEIGKEAGKKGWDLAGYTFLGAAIGGASGFIGTEIEAMDFIGSGTLGLIASSTYSSYGMYELSGRTREFTTSVGFGSMNWSKGRFDYLGKEGNSTSDNVGYLLGSLTNISDGVAIWDKYTRYEERLWKKYTELGKERNPNDYPVDPKSLKRGFLGWLFGTSYPGGNNPQYIDPISGKWRDYFGHIKNETFLEVPAALHDGDWSDLGQNADIFTLATSRTSLNVDTRFVSRNFLLGAKHFRTNPINSIKAFTIGGAFGVIVLPKTMYYSYMR